MAKLPTDTIEEFEQYQLDEPSNGSQSNIENTPNGSVLATGELASPNFVSGRTGWRMDSAGNFEAVNGTFSGSLSAISLNIPDTTTANSFHVDSSGNTWWGTNLATGYPTAPAYILDTGAAHFENVEIGGTTIQYVITNSGIFSFGDGSDGDVTISVDTTLSSDKYYNNLTVNAGVTLNPGGYRIFVKGTLTLNGTIARNGTAGNNGAAGGLTIPWGGPGDQAGNTLADGYLKGSVAPGFGGGTTNNTGVPHSGGNGTSTTNSLGSNGVGGAGTGGAGRNSIGTTSAGAGGGSGGTATASNVKLIANWHLATLLDITSTGASIKFDNSGGAAGGGAGGVGQNNNGGQTITGGAGGSGGTSGGIVAVYARVVIIGAAGSITANGGKGGDGGHGFDGNGGPGAGGGGGGGGGSGGNGGIIILVYNSLTNSGSITASGGAKGVGGTPGVGVAFSGDAGTDGTAGSAGTIYQFQLSL